jgi:photosystem II stability/assembly factor-like uncharacterized protein
MFRRAGLNTLAVDPNDPDTIFAGTYGAGIYVSRDGGRAWTPSNQGLGKGTVSRLVVDPSDSNFVYAALFDQGGVYKSADGGRTWGAVSTGIDLDRGWDWAALISIDPSDSRRLYYAGATEGFYLSTNGGQRWSRQSADCPQVMDFVVDPVDFEHIYAANHMHSGPGCLTGVYESSDGGKTWKLLTTAEMAATNELGGDFWNVVADPQDFSTLYAGNHLATHKSSDRGQRWAQIRDAGCDWLATNPSDGAIYCGQGREMEISHDGGASWSSVNLGGWGRWNSRPFAVAPNAPQTLYAGSDGVMKSSDGGETWLRIGWLGAARMQLTVDPRDGDRLFLGGRDGPCETYRSEDGGETWQAIATDAGGCTVAVAPAQNILYRPDRSRGAYRSRDNGLTWERFGSGYRDTWQLVPDPQDTTKLWITAGCGARPFLSEDGGVTFAEVESFPHEICGDPILLAHPDGKRVYVEDNGSIYRSEDGGQTWDRLADLGGLYRAAALDPFDPDTVYFGSTHKGVFGTTDGGRTWFQANVGLTAFSINELAIDPTNTEIIYAATDGGAFVSLDGGKQWWPIQQGLGPNPIVYSIAVDPNDPFKVYAVTPDGVFRLEGTRVEVAASAPTATPVEASMWCDVWCWLDGPAGDPASRNPHTGLDAIVQGRNAIRNAVQIVVESPSGETIILQPYGDIPYGWEGRFSGLIQGLPQAGGTYTFTALDADGAPIPGAVASDVYLGGREPDPPTNVQAEVVEAGILVTWDPSRVIPGSFEPNGSPPLGFYSFYIREEGQALYGWSNEGRPLPETSYLIPFRRQDFGPGDAGLALEEIDDGVYYLELHTFSDEPKRRAGQHAECIAYNPAESIRIVIEGGQVHIEEP